MHGSSARRQRGARKQSGFVRGMPGPAVPGPGRLLEAKPENLDEHRLQASKRFRGDVSDVSD